MSAERVETIVAVLLDHGTKSGGICYCGHKYRPGDSIAHHRAEAINVGISLAECGVPNTAINEAVRTALAILENGTAATAEEMVLEILRQNRKGN